MITRSTATRGPLSRMLYLVAAGVVFFLMGLQGGGLRPVLLVVGALLVVVALAVFITDFVRRRQRLR